MAYRKKGAKSASRRSYRRRYTRRRRYRRKYTRRSGKRFPRGTEVKSKSWCTCQSLSVTAEANMISFKPGFVSIIGTAEDTPYGMGVSVGNAQGQRIGAKFEPIKLRISGSISLQDSGSVGGNTIQAPNFWQVRVLVYQVKGGNTSLSPEENGYHQLALASETDDGWIEPDQLRRILMTYRNSVGNDSIFSEEDWLRNNLLGKIPLRRGIGGLCRVLYKKTFWINTQKNPVKQFRFITKVPKRFVYPEVVANDLNSTPSTVPNNAVYILWMFQPGSFKVPAIPTLNMAYNVDLFYTDK